MKQINATMFVCIMKACIAPATIIDLVRKTANVKIKENTKQNAKKIQNPPYWSKLLKIRRCQTLQNNPEITLLSTKFTLSKLSIK